MLRPRWEASGLFARARKGRVVESAYDAERSIEGRPVPSARPRRVVLKAGPCVHRSGEPRQVRKEATVTKGGASWENLTGAAPGETTGGNANDGGRAQRPPDPAGGSLERLPPTDTRDRRRMRSGHIER